MRRWLAILVLWVAWSLPGPAASAPPHNAPAVEVKVGVFITSLHDFNFLNGSYAIDFYAWWIMDRRYFDPVQELQVVNGREWHVYGANQRRLVNGQYYTAAFVSAVINQDWHLRYYPFDSQALEVILETPLTASELRQVPDVAGSRLSEFVGIPGFDIGNLTVSEYISGYDTSFGIGEDSAKRFSRLVITMDARRQSGHLLTSLFIGFIAANLINFFVFFVNVELLSVRVTIIASAVFVAVGNMYFLSGQVAPPIQSTLVDSVALMTFAVIIVALATSIAAERLFARDKGRLAWRINWILFTLVAGGVLGSLGYAFHDAMF